MTWRPQKQSWDWGLQRGRGEGVGWYPAAKGKRKITGCKERGLGQSAFCGGSDGEQGEGPEGANLLEAALQDEKPLE